MTSNHISGRKRIAAGIVLSAAASIATADMTLPAGESCASASCHASLLSGSGVHDGGPDQRRCSACHVADDPGTHAFRFAAEGGELCVGCHARLTQGTHKHAPADLGLCTFCHAAHDSKYPARLKFPAEALCVSCHDKIVPDGARTVHGPVGRGRCTACHDPHSSDIDDQLVAEIPQLCFGCHNEDQTDHQGRMLRAVEPSFIDKSLRQHPPFARGDCLLCHDPHASDNIRLQRRPYAEAFYTSFKSEKYFCLMCHGESTFTEPRTLTATKFRNGNLNLHNRHVDRDKGRGCRACHHQHASGLEAQIATETFLGEQDVGIKAFAKSESGGTCEPSCHRPVRYDRIRPVNNGFMVTPPEGAEASPAELSRAQDEHDGKTLFLQRCAGCHGADAEGKIGPPIKGATLDRVVAATGRVNLMADLASLDPDDLRAIVDALPPGAPVVALPEGASDGMVLFSTNCAGCHGPDASGRIGPAIRGVTGADITQAIGRVPMMIAMKSLSTDSIGAIGDYLSSLGKGTMATGGTAATEALDGKVAFSMNCSGCHGPDAEGRIGPPIRGMSIGKINDALGRVPMMAGLKMLGSAEIAAISRHLVSLEDAALAMTGNGQVDGKAFFAASCSACHGEDASGHIGPNIRGHTADDVKAAIARVPMMVGVKSSTEGQIKAVGEYIHGLAEAPASAMPAPPDGAAVFAQRCAACHGADATGMVGPNITSASAEDITAAINRVPMMVVMKVLGAREIGAVAEHLAKVRAAKSPESSE